MSSDINQYWIYMMCNAHNDVLYIGITNDLYRRVLEHKSGAISGFTEKYNCHKLVYYEEFNRVEEALSREKQLKNWKREWKNELVIQMNPDWNDLSAEWVVPEKYLPTKIKDHESSTR